MKAMATNGELDGRERWGAYLGIPCDPCALHQHVVESRLQQRELKREPDALNTLASYNPSKKTKRI